MKKEMIMSGMILIILIGIVSAGLIEYYGKVVQTFEIQGPVVEEEWVFYLGNGNNLLINELPGGGTPGIEDNELRVWINESLGGINFNYIPKINFYVRAKIYDDDDVPQNLTLIFGYNNIELCSVNISINSSGLENYGPFSCESNSIPINIESFYYGMKGNCDDCKYGISKGIGSEDFYTKIEVIGTV